MLANRALLSGQSVPRVSVIIPTYNRAHFVGQALQSVLEQFCSDYEIIVIDDGSTDDTRQIVQAFVGPIRYLYQNNCGVSAARNRGILMAQGRYITFLDSDDWYMPHKLAKQVDYLERTPQVGAVYSWYIEINEHDNRQYLRCPDLSGKVYKQFLSKCMFGLMAVPTVMVRREVLEVVGLFDEQMTMIEDNDLWCRIARLYDIGLIREPLCNIRRHEGNTEGTEFLAMSLHLADKAFQADPTLPWLIRRQIYANIYGYSSGYVFFDEKRRAAALKQLLRGLLYWPLPDRTIRLYVTRMTYSIIHCLPHQLTAQFLQWWHRWRDEVKSSNA